MKAVTKWLITASAVAGVAMGGAGILHAATTSNPQYPMSNLVNAIATKFNLNPSDVQQVFDSQRLQMQQQVQARQSQMLKARLDQAVKDGELTQAQEDLITAKETEVQSFMQGLLGKSVTDRQTAIKTEMDSLTQWAKDNNIPTQFVPFGHGGMGGWDRHGMKPFARGGAMGMGMGRGHWQQPQTQTQQ